MTTSSEIQTICPSCFVFCSATALQCDACGAPLPGAGPTPVAAISPAPPSSPHQPAPITPASLRPVVTIARPQRPKAAAHIRLGWLQDVSASGVAYEAGMRQIFAEVCQHIERKAGSVEVWIQTHVDEDDGILPRFIVEGGTLEDARHAFGNTCFEGGFGIEETHADAAQRAIRAVPWLCDPTRGRDVLVLATSQGDTKHLKDGSTLEAFAAEIERLGLIYVHVGVPERRLARLFEAIPGALFIPLSNTPDPDECARVAALCAASIMVGPTHGQTTVVVQ